MLNENVKKLLKENMWDRAACSAGAPNVVPVAFKDVTDDGKHDAAQPRREWRPHRNLRVRRQDT